MAASVATISMATTGKMLGLKMAGLIRLDKRCTIMTKRKPFFGCDKHEGTSHTRVCGDRALFAGRSAANGWYWLAAGTLSCYAAKACTASLAGNALVIHLLAR